MVRAELHCHSRRSADGLPEPVDLLRRAALRGIAVLAITDHDTMAGLREARAAGLAAPLLVPAMEVSTLDGEVLALFVEEEIPPGLPLARAVERVRGQGGLAVCPHPFDAGRGNSCDPGRHDPALWDAVETVNAASKDPRARARAEDFARKHGLPELAGSDAHTLWALGRATTLLDLEPPLALGAVRQALAKGSLRIDGGLYPARVRLWQDAAKRARGTALDGVARALDRRFAGLPPAR